MQKTIFIVDDDQAICEGMFDILDAEGYKVFPFSSGEEALKQFEEVNPDLCIIDYKMPGMDGLELIKRVRKIKPDIRNILFTGSLLEITDMEISNLGIIKVLNKPIARKDILSSVYDALNGNIKRSGGKNSRRKITDRRIIKDRRKSISSESKNDLSYLFKEEKEGEWKKGRILIVDDDEELRLHLKDALTSNNYYTQTVGDGSEALKIVESDDFDIILMDIHMPRMNGIETVNKIKLLNPNAFVVMITGEADDEEIRLAIENGGYTCLRKPFTIKKLLKSLEWYGKAQKDIKLKNDLAGSNNKKSNAAKMFIRLRSSIKEKYESNKMLILTVVLSVSSIIFGVLLLLFIQSTGNSVHDYLSRGMSKYEGYAERILGYLERDERRELGR